MKLGDLIANGLIECAGLDGACECEAAAEKQQYAPGEFDSRVPIQGEDAIAKINGNDEEGERGENGHGAVLEPGEHGHRAFERLAEDPKKHSGEEDAHHDHFGARCSAQGAKLFANKRTTARHLLVGQAIQHAREEKPCGQEHGGRNRDAQHHPTGKIDLEPEAFAKDAEQDAVGRGANGRSDATNGRGVCD